MTKIEALVRQNIRSLAAYSSAKDEFSGTDALFLDANENPYGKLNRYPDPQQRKLKNVLVKQSNISSDQIFIGNGSDEVIDLLLRIFCEPRKDCVAAFSPTYGMYQVSAAINNVEFVEIPLDASFDITNCKLDPLFSNDRFKIVFLCSPNNPTGNDLNREKMRELIASFSGIVCVDEAYIEFSAQNSLAEWIATYDNLVILRTFSKARGLAGARIGYAFAQPEIIRFLNKVKPPYNVSALNQEAAIHSLSEESQYEDYRKLIIQERERLQMELQQIPVVQRVFPSSANFILIEVSDADRIYQTLLDQNIIVRNRSKLIPNTLRISFGTKQENDTLLTALKQLTV